MLLVPVSEADLKALQIECKLSSILVANLRQLLGWTAPRAGFRTRRAWSLCGCLSNMLSNERRREAIGM
jgi:hypothetical protein